MVEKSMPQCICIEKKKVIPERIVNIDKFNALTFIIQFEDRLYWYSHEDICILIRNEMP